MVRGKVAGKTSRRTAWIPALLAGLVTVAFAATPAWAGKIHGRLQGVVDGLPTAGLTLPLPSGAPNVMATLFLGGTSGPPVPFTITPDTKVNARDSQEKGSTGSVTFVNGDSIEVSSKLVMGAIVATKIRLENPYIVVFGTVQAPPGGSLSLPLAVGAPNVTITLSLGGVGGPPLPIVVTPNTKVKTGTTLTLVNNDLIGVKAVIQSGQIVAVKIRKVDPMELEAE